MRRRFVQVQPPHAMRWRRVDRVDCSGYVCNLCAMHHFQLIRSNSTTVRWQIWDFLSTPAEDELSVTCKVYKHPSKTVYQKAFVDSVPPFFCPLWKCTTIPCRNCTIPFFAYLSCLKVYQHPMLNVYQHFWSFVHFIPRKFCINAIVWNCTIFLCGNCTNIFPLCNLH